MKHLLLALLATSALSADYDPARFEKEIIVPACNDPMQLEVMADGRVFFIERDGSLKLVEPQTKRVIVVGKRDVLMTGEIGMLGLALDREFAKTQALFLFFSPLEKPGTLRLSRFVLKDGKLDLGSEKMLFDYTLEDPKLQHQGGGLFMAPNGDLILGTGDNSTTKALIQHDDRPGMETHDAQRTSANSMTLRGKVLRIHPTADGGYSIPDGNLFRDGNTGRAEIFAMGVRNPFRQFVDAQTGFIYWGDVGQNIEPSINVGPNGYDEVNQARVAGNFGWPYFTGANEAYRHFDFDTGKAGELYDVKAPRNDSRNNTGAKELPLPKPAFIWYPSTESKEFPMLGSGGRSAMVGPLYRHDASVTNELKLPEHFDHTLFTFDWMRNWIMAVHLDADERIASIAPFLPEWRLRKPIELKLAPDHTLYLIESGDQWSGNTDSQISRIVYRRGNRPPEAIASAANNAGKLPLKVRFDGTRSSDNDGDALSYEWKFGLGGALGSSKVAAPEFVFTVPGVHPVTLTVTDTHGASHLTSLEVRAGNAPPSVTFAEPVNGGFYQPEQRITYRLTATDEEDGTIAAEQVTLTTTTRDRLTRDEAALPSGLAMMRGTTCFACHITNAKSVGPAYLEVAKKYRGNNAARELLAQKIVSGGVGVWGKEIPMPPHPQHTLDQTRQMADWILSLHEESSAARVGISGELTAPPAPLKDWRKPPAPVFQLTAAVTDKGAAGVPPMRAETTLVLHPQRKRAALFDAMHSAETVDVFEGGEGNVLRMKSGGWFRLDTMNLAGITHLTARVAPLATGSYMLEAHLDIADGPLIGSELIACMTDDTASQYGEITFPIAASEGVHNIVFTARIAEKPLFNKAFPPPASGRILDVNWIEFRDNPLPKSARAPTDGRPRVKVLLVAGKQDHPWMTHMYSAVIELLATELNKSGDIEAIVSPDFGWPGDEKVFEGVKGIVYYTGGIGDFIMGEHGAAFEKLMQQGIGFSALHYSTGAKLHGPRYMQFTGGWWTNSADGLAIGPVDWKYLAPEHPILRGLPPVHMSDEIYRHTTLHPKATPLIQVNIKDRDDVVA
jgi:cytochrome c